MDMVSVAAKGKFASRDHSPITSAGWFEPFLKGARLGSVTLKESPDEI